MIPQFNWMNNQDRYFRSKWRNVFPKKNMCQLVLDMSKVLSSKYTALLPEQSGKGTKSNFTSGEDAECVWESQPLPNCHISNRGRRRTALKQHRDSRRWKAFSGHGPHALPPLARGSTGSGRWLSLERGDSWRLSQRKPVTTRWAASTVDNVRGKYSNLCENGGRQQPNHLPTGSETADRGRKQFVADGMLPPEHTVSPDLGNKGS